MVEKDRVRHGDMRTATGETENSSHRVLKTLRILGNNDTNIMLLLSLPIARNNLNIM